MKQKFKFLLATIMMLVGITAQAATKTVTWDSSIISTLVQNKTYTDANGITVSGDDALTKNWRGTSMFSFENYDGVDNVVFSLSNGNFTSIVINCSDISIEDASLDNGFTQNGNSVTWSGNANTITLKAISDYGFISFFPTSIVFTIEVDNVNVSGVTLSQATADMTVGGETLTLTATVAPDDATDKSVTWTTSDPTVATVANGVVTAVAAGSATITATATNGTDDTSDDKTATCTVTVMAAATQYDLTVGESLHGTVAFSVDGTAATTAKKDDMVTVTVTPAEGYSAKDVTVRAYTSWEAASAILTGGGDTPGLVSDITVSKNTEDGTWQFTMPEANVWVVVTYAKNLQDAWIQAIADQTYTGEAIEPTVTVKDGETTLVLNTDYTVAYSDNTAAGTATVTITAVEGSNYSGTATKTFTIVKADITMTTAPAAVSGLVYSGEAQTLITAGVASFGTVLYSLDGTNFSDALPQGTDAGTYTVTYKVEGDANHNAFEAQTVSVTIATNKTELNNAITEAEAYYNSISETNPDAAAVLQAAINAAKTVQGNANATQTEIETAAQTLTDALNAAKADVALKRITLVIPAKSYMARIDADKRQIENAVDGVKLYSVKSVTDTEVELTGELSVIAAEMPYFIYNDNDTEVEVSIVVSSEEADNVDYDSEHFKGTLVDKTFTDEDMEEADHYVLSSGSNFVWVKDAGTLAAGKCWIELVPASEAHARRLVIVHEGDLTPTGISTVKTTVDTKDAAVYDLQGRRVMQPTKGLFIVNGKKVVIK